MTAHPKYILAEKGIPINVNPQATNETPRAPKKTPMEHMNLRVTELSERAEWLEEKLAELWAAFQNNTEVLEEMQKWAILHGEESLSQRVESLERNTEVLWRTMDRASWKEMQEAIAEENANQEGK